MSVPEPGGTRARGGTLVLLLSWTFVALPLAWGVAQTVVKSMALLR